LKRIKRNIHVKLNIKMAKERTINEIRQTKEYYTGNEHQKYAENIQAMSIKSMLKKLINQKK
jgi:hypothetical protein